MSELISWKNQEIDKLRKDINRSLRRFCAGFGVPLSLIEVAEPYRMDLSETDKALILTARLPGFTADDIDVSVTENTLIIRGESRGTTVENGDTFRRVEKRSESFSRTIRLPCRVMVDDVEATYKDNVLQISLPKCERRESKGIRIALK